MPADRGRSGEELPENSLGCWFTVLASGLLLWGKVGTYIGPPTELRSGVNEFVQARAVNQESDPDSCFWHYRGGVGSANLNTQQEAKK